MPPFSGLICTSLFAGINDCRMSVYVERQILTESISNRYTRYDLQYGQEFVLGKYSSCGQ